jgi:replicative DNA helicase
LPSVGLVVIGGLPGSGKTWSWIKLSSEFAKEHPDKLVAFFSLEMILGEIKERYNAMSYPAEVMHRIRVCPHPMNVEAVIAKAATFENLGLVGIDFADLLVEKDTNESEMTRIYRVLMLGAKELNCPIVLYAQLNGSTERLPRPNNLRWTRLAEALGWSVLMLYNPATDWREGITTKTKLQKYKNHVYLLAWKMRGGFRNHLDDNPGAISISYRQDKGFGNNSHWFKIDDED